MTIYDIKTLKELDDYLRYGPARTHDALFEKICIDKKNKSVSITLYEPYESVQTDIFLKNVCLFFSIETDSWGTDDESIYSFVAVDSLIGIENIVKEANLNTERLLHLIFEMFSGNEIHILCEEICFSVKNNEQHQI